MGNQLRQPGHSPGKTWYERDSGELERLKDIVNRHPSRLAVRIDGERKQVFLEGKLYFDTGLYKEHLRVRLTVSADHPRTEPRAEDIDSVFPKTADFHKIPGTDIFCLWLDAESAWSGDGASLTAYLDQVLLHVDRSFICQADPDNRWPGPAHQHSSAAAYLQLLTETVGSEPLALIFVDGWQRGRRYSRNGPCICGSAKKWKRCHRDKIEAFEHRAGGNAKLRRLFAESPGKDGTAA